MKKCYEYFFLQTLLILLLFGLANGSELLRKSATTEIDSLRMLIQVAQDSLIKLESIQSQLEREFQQVNARIYHYKQDSTNGNPLKNYRLQSALKTSHKMADQIEKHEMQIKSLEKKLQYLYQTSIQQIDREIQKNLTNSKKAFDQKKNSSIKFKTIQKLEKEKADYYDRLKAIKIIDEDWKNLRLEPGDTSQRIQLKTAILQDKRTSLELSIQQQNVRLEELKKDRKVYQEMLGFYADLKLAIDDEQEFFDRNRIDELKDRVDDIDTKIRELEQDIYEMNADAESLKIKIELFRSAASDKNTTPEK